MSFSYLCRDSKSYGRRNIFFSATRQGRVCRQSNRVINLTD